MNATIKLTWWICARLTSMYIQLSVEKAMASSATATMAVIVARDKVTAEQGIVSQLKKNNKMFTFHYDKNLGGGDNSCD